jgi:hypothetical protein
VGQFYPEIGAGHSPKPGGKPEPLAGACFHKTLNTLFFKKIAPFSIFLKFFLS